MVFNICIAATADCNVFVNTTAFSPGVAPQGQGNISLRNPDAVKPEAPVARGGWEEVHVFEGVEVCIPVQAERQKMSHWQDQ